MAKMSDPKFSGGARFERAAIRAFVRRLLKRQPGQPHLETVLVWILGRQDRYDKSSGGLGRK